MTPNPPTRVLRHRRIALSAALAGLLALGASGQAPAPGTVIPTTRAAPGTTIPTYTQPTYGTGQPTYGPNTAINSSPANSAGPFPQDIYRFSQSGAVPTPVPMPSLNFQTTPTGVFTPIPAH